MRWSGPSPSEWRLRGIQAAPRPPSSESQMRRGRDDVGVTAGEDPGHSQPNPENDEGPGHPCQRRGDLDVSRAEERQLVVGNRRGEQRGRFPLQEPDLRADELQAVGMCRGEWGEEDGDGQGDGQAGGRHLAPAPAVRKRIPLVLIRLENQVGTAQQDEPEHETRDDRLADADRGMHQGHPAQDVEEIGPATRGGQLEGEGPGSEQHGEPGRDHAADQDPLPPADRAPDRGIDRVAADGADQAHVHEVRPERRQAAVAEEETLDDQHRPDDHRARPGAEHHRSEHSPEQVTRDRQRSDREVHHLRREDERRHRPHQDRRPLPQPSLQLAEPDHEPRERQRAGRRRHLRIEHRVGNVHGCDSRAAAEATFESAAPHPNRACA